MPPAPPPLVDTHCHLSLLEQRGLLQPALESAVSHGVTQLVTIGLDLEDSDRNRRLAEDCSGADVVFTVGWHPHRRRPPDSAELAALRELLDHPRAVAVGEIGCDLFFRLGYHETPLETQLRSLRIMLELADDCGKPVVIHDRDAHEHVVSALEPFARRRGATLGRPAGVLHCFSGDVALGRWAEATGFLCSFAGTITFPRSDAVLAAARQLGDESLVVETDAPFLSPVPHRGRPNLPGYVAFTAGALAELRARPPAAVSQLTTANARRLFRLPGAEPSDG